MVILGYSAGPEGVGSVSRRHIAVPPRSAQWPLDFRLPLPGCLLRGGSRIGLGDPDVHRNMSLTSAPRWVQARMPGETSRICIGLFWEPRAGTRTERAACWGSVGGQCS